MDTARSLAAELVDDIGWLGSMRYVAGRVLAATSPRRFWRGLELLIAVTFA